MFIAAVIMGVLSMAVPYNFQPSNHTTTKTFPITIRKQAINNINNLIIINITTQQLQLFNQGKLQNTYLISTSKKGPGQQLGSSKTPIGLHKVCEKIGAKAPPYAIFKSRQFTGNIWPKHTPRHLHNKDYIVTRILRLEGLEPGINKGQDKYGTIVDSKTRTIYIHGTTMEWKLGYPSTIGCIHMRNNDIVQLFDSVSVGTLVLITT